MRLSGAPQRQLVYSIKGVLWLTKGSQRHGNKNNLSQGVLISEQCAGFAQWVSIPRA